MFAPREAGVSIIENADVREMHSWRLSRTSHAHGIVLAAREAASDLVGGGGLEGTAPTPPLHPLLPTTPRDADFSFGGRTENAHESALESVSRADFRRFMQRFEPVPLEAVLGPTLAGYRPEAVRN